MRIHDTGIQGLLLIEPQVFRDERGYFFESYQEQRYRQAGITSRFVQDNESRSAYGVLRGLHYQLPPFDQAKLVRVIEGEVIDAAVDLREGSPTYGQAYAVHLTAENKLQLFVPRGFAHGYSVISETAVFAYKCDNYYSRDHEAGIRADDPLLGIDWRLDTRQAVISGKDRVLPAWGDHRPFK